MPGTSSHSGSITTVPGGLWLRMVACIRPTERRIVAIADGPRPRRCWASASSWATGRGRPSRTATTLSAPIAVAALLGTGLTMPPSTAVYGPMPTAENNLAAGLQIGRDHRQREPELLDPGLQADLPDLGRQSDVGQQAAPRQGRPEEDAVERIQEPNRLLSAEPHGIQPGHRRANAGAGQVVRLQPNPREPSQDADVGVAPVSASAQREAELEPGEVAGDPAERDTSRCRGGQDATCQLGTVSVRERRDRDQPAGGRAAPYRPIDPRCERPVAA